MSDTHEEMLESFNELREDLQAVIRELRSRIGRMPTEVEVTSFIFAEDDETRQRILDEAKG